MIEQRVQKLEEGMRSALEILQRIEPKVIELSIGAAKQVDLAELKGKVSNLPTTITLLSIVFSTWALGSGILIFAMNVLKR